MGGNEGKGDKDKGGRNGKDDYGKEDPCEVNEQ